MNWLFGSPVYILTNGDVQRQFHEWLAARDKVRVEIYMCFGLAIGLGKDGHVMVPERE